MFSLYQSLPDAGPLRYPPIASGTASSIWWHCVWSRWTGSHRPRVLEVYAHLGVVQLDNRECDTVVIHSIREHEFGEFGRDIGHVVQVSFLFISVPIVNLM